MFKIQGDVTCQSHTTRPLELGALTNGIKRYTFEVRETGHSTSVLRYWLYFTVISYHKNSCRLCCFLIFDLAFKGIVVVESQSGLAARRTHAAGVLSGGERRLLEISRALVMGPEILLVDEPSIGLELRFINMVFKILDDLQHNEGKTIIMVEQNVKKRLRKLSLCLHFCLISFIQCANKKAETWHRLCIDKDNSRCHKPSKYSNLRRK